MATHLVDPLKALSGPMISEVTPLDFVHTC